MTIPGYECRTWLYVWRLPEANEGGKEDENDKGDQIQGIGRRLDVG